MALRNCTRDEGRCFEVSAIKVLISSHRKLLLSKAMVVNVAEKSGRGEIPWAYSTKHVVALRLLSIV